jgi:asparagine synthase (glutamine-hydrolysing)
MWTWGYWRQGELRTVVGPSGCVTVIGQCLVDDHLFAQTARDALESGRWTTLTRWPGSYLVIVLRDEQLLAFADLAGQYPLYYAHVHGRTVFGTDAGATARAAGLAPRPDRLTLAAQVFCPATPDLVDGRSPIAGVSRLGGGCALRVMRDGACTSWTYETLAPGATATLSDAAEALRCALSGAVRARVATGRPVTADFSGGLDSTSVAFLAARYGTAPLHVFSYHHADAPAGDVGYAQRYASLEPRIRLEVVQGDPTTLTYQRFAPPAEEAPDFAAASWARTSLRLRRLAAIGAGVHLGGEGADALLAVSPAYLADLADHRMFYRLGREASALARARCASPATVLTRSVRLSRTSISSALHQLAGQLEHPVDRTPNWLDAISWWPAPSGESQWLTRAMRRRIAEQARAGAARATLAEDLGIADVVALTELRASGTVQRRLSEVARAFSVWPQAPFLDNEVVRACTMVAAYRRTDPTTVKPLLRQALSGLVPDQVFARRTKGNYIGEDYQGARRSLPELTARIARSRLADLGVIEPRAVLASLVRVQAGAHVPIPALNRILGAEVWLEAWF